MSNVITGKFGQIAGEQSEWEVDMRFETDAGGDLIGPLTTVPFKISAAKQVIYGNWFYDVGILRYSYILDLLETVMRDIHVTLPIISSLTVRRSVDKNADDISVYLWLHQTKLIEPRMKAGDTTPIIEIEVRTMDKDDHGIDAEPFNEHPYLLNLAFFKENPCLNKSQLTIMQSNIIDRIIVPQGGTVLTSTIGASTVLLGAFDISETSMITIAVKINS